MVTEFHKSKLNRRNQVVYEQLLQGFSLMREEVECDGSFTQDMVDCFNAVCNDHPELFFLTNQPAIKKPIGFFGGKCSVVSNHIYSQGEALQRKSAMDRVVKNIAALTKNCKGEADIVKVVCDYFIKNVRYEINNHYNQNASTVLLQNKGQCSGISKAVKLVLEYLDVDCIYVEGQGQASLNTPYEGHAWNIVYVEGQCYHLDVTYLIGCNEQKKLPYDYTWYNCSDSIFAINHQWDQNKYPVCKVDAIKPQRGNYNNGYQQNFSNQSNSNRQNSNYQQNIGGKVICSYAEFRKEIGIALDKNAQTFSFNSKIPEKDAQKLLDEVLQLTVTEARMRKMGVSLHAQSQGALISITINKI